MMSKDHNEEVVRPVPGALYPVLASEDRLPGEELLGHVVSAVLDWRLQVHDVGVAPGAVGRGGGLRVHVLAVLGLLALQHQVPGPVGQRHQLMLRRQRTE